MRREKMSRNRKVLVFGKTGSGKSTLANMLVSGSLLKPLFPMGDSMRGVTNKCIEHVGRGYQVTDTVGLGEETESERRHAKKIIKNFLRAAQHNFHLLFFVKQAGRHDELDATIWKIFLEIFQQDKDPNKEKGIYRGIVVVFTSCSNRDRLLKNSRDLNKHYPEVENRFIAVDFPAIDEDEELEAFYSRRRLTHLEKFNAVLDSYFPPHDVPPKFFPKFAKMNDEQLEIFSEEIYTLISNLAQAIGKSVDHGLRTGPQRAIHPNYHLHFSSSHLTR